MQYEAFYEFMTSYCCFAKEKSSAVVDDTIPFETPWDLHSIPTGREKIPGFEVVAALVIYYSNQSCEIFSSLRARRKNRGKCAIAPFSRSGAPVTAPWDLRGRDQKGHYPPEFLVPSSYV